MQHVFICTNNKEVKQSFTKISKITNAGSCLSIDDKNYSFS